MPANGQTAAGVTVPDTKLAREATELGHRSVAELEEDLSSAAAKAEPERLGKLASAAVSLDEPLHEGPGLLDGIIHHATVRPR
jgi:hypothetical protein